MRELVIDSFAGGGGASLGIAWAVGRPPDIAINHDPDALAMHAANHPSTKHVVEDVWQADLRQLVGDKPVGLLWASPDCKHFSRAKGSVPVSKEIRSLAWIVVRWASQVRPRMIILENVREFSDWGPLVDRGDGEMVPCKDRKGMTFRLFCNRLRGLGYKVETRNLNAADYGAPTHRRRLFLIARRDGAPIEWPKPTHADPAKINTDPLMVWRKPWRTAAECIDWSIECPSIFTRKKPLVDKTMRRIALGLKRYVLEAADPFIVPITHSGKRRVPSLNEPLPTVTTAHRGELAICSPTLIQTGYGERKGQSPRVPGLHKPLGTVVSGGSKHAVVSAFLAKHFGGMVGTSIETPLPTTTTRGTQNQIAAAYLTRFNHGEKQWNSVGEPLGTVTSQGNKYGLVYAFLTKYFGTAIGQASDVPLGTTTEKHRFGVVQVEIEPGKFENAVALNIPEIGPCVIADIGMRMLQPRELARAQGFPDTYELTGTKTNQVAKIGNSVCPQCAAAIVECNYSTCAEAEVSAPEATGEVYACPR